MNWELFLFKYLLFAPFLIALALIVYYWKIRIIYEGKIVFVDFSSGIVFALAFKFAVLSLTSFFS